MERASAKRRLECAFVFHLDRQPVGDFKRSSATACKAAGVGKVLVHDPRRTTVRNMISRVLMKGLNHELGLVG